MSNGTTPSKKDGSLKKANWVDSAPKEGVEGHDYFIRGTKYTNSNVSAKYGGVMNMSGVTQAFKPFSYTDEKPIKTGSASSLDRMQAMIDNLNQSSSTVVNNPNISQFKKETKYETPDNKNLTSSIEKSNQNVEGQEMKQRSRERSDAQYAKSNVTGEFLKDKHGNLTTKKDNDEWEANRDLQSRMNVESGRFSDGSMFNQYGQSAATAQGDAKRRFQGGSPVYSFADDLTRSATGSMVEMGRSKGGSINPLGIVGQGLEFMGVDEKGVGLGETAKQIAWHAPGSGEIMDAWQLGKDVYKGMKTGSFDDAKLSLGALAVPFASAGDVKKGYKATQQLFKGASHFTNITGGVNKFSKATGGFASKMSKNNPFKMHENLALNFANKQGGKIKSTATALKNTKDKYNRNILQRESIEDNKKEENKKIAVNKENSGVTKPRG